MAGNIEARGKGTWRVRIFMGEDPDTGKPIQHRKTIHGTKKDAQTYLNAILRERDLGRFAEPSKMTLNEYLTKWLDTAKPRLRRSTLESYTWVLERYVRPALGAHRMERITPMAVQETYAALLADGLSARTVRYAHAVLHAAMDQAVGWRHIPGNPTDHVDLPKQQRTERPTVTPDQTEAFWNAALEDRWGALFLLALFGGLRPGEYQGLQWPDIDMITGAVTIVRVVEWHEDRTWAFCEPKTPKSRRTIILPPELVPVLRAHRERQDEEKRVLGKHYHDHALVFASANGEPVDRRNLTARHLKHILKAAGIPETLRLYDLRHSCATLLLASNENPKVVAERLGHASVVLTLDTYSHVSPGMQQAAADKLSAFIPKPKAPAQEPEKAPEGEREPWACPGHEESPSGENEGERESR